MLFLRVWCSVFVCTIRWVLSHLIGHILVIGLCDDQITDTQSIWAFSEHSFSSSWKSKTPNITWDLSKKCWKINQSLLNNSKKKKTYANITTLRKHMQCDCPCNLKAKYYIFQYWRQTSWEHIGHKQTKINGSLSFPCLPVTSFTFVNH